MVLRFNCPGCRAPYSVADQFAGRTLQCTQCGTAIQIGAPAPPVQQPPAGLTGSMEWSGDNLQQPNLQQQQQPPPQQAQGGSLDLLPDDDPGFRDDDDEEEEDEPPPRKRAGGRTSSRQGKTPSRQGKTPSRQGKTSGRQGKAKGRKTSGRQTSDRQRKGSGGGRAPRGGRKSTGGGVATRDCPVCGDEIASVAETCMHCGTRLKGPSVASQLPKQIAQLAGPLLALALIGGSGYFLYSTFVDKEEKKTVKVKTRKTRKTRKTEKTEAGKTKTGKTEAPGKTEKTEAPRKTESPRKTLEHRETPGPRETPEPLPENPDVVEVAGNVIPEGDHKALFQALLDAGDGKPGREAVLALGKLDVKTGIPLITAAAQSDDRRYRLRLHRALLRLGDAAAQKAAIEASIKSHRGVKLFWTVLVAIELDPVAYRSPLLSIGYDADTSAGRALADACLDGGRVSSNHLDVFRQMFDDGGPELQETLAPLFVLAGGVEALTDTAKALDHPSEPIRKLAKAALLKVSAGQGPGEAGSASDWAAWVKAYQPIRDLLGAATRDIGIMPNAKGTLERNKALAALVALGPEVLKTLPVFLREEAARKELACRVIAALIVRLGTKGDRELLSGVLSALESHDEAATQVIAAVMVVADADLAAEAAKAVIQAGIPARRQGEFPDLKREPKPAAVQGIVDWADGRSDSARQDAFMLAASFRPPQLGKSLAEGRKLASVKPMPVAARLGSAKVEAALLAVLRGDKPTGFGISSAPDAIRRLRTVGTSANSQGPLLKIVNAREIEHGSLPLALSAVCAPSAIRKLKKAFEGWKKPAMTTGMYRAYGEIGGKKGVAELGKRFLKLEETSAVRRSLTRVILDLGAEAGRDEALRPFLSLKEKGWQEGFRLDPTQFHRVMRCAKSEDGALLVEFLKEGKPSKTSAGLCLVAIGVMGYKPGLSQATGFIFENHADRARAAASAALLGGGQQDMLSMLGSEAVLKRVKGEDLEVLASLATLDPGAAQKAAKPFVEAMAGGKISNPRALMALAFALAMSNDPGLESLADVNDPLARAAVARGIAWAAISSTKGIEYPPVLELLRNDPEPLVRVEAAIARCYLDRKDAVAELGRNLPFLTELELTSDRMPESSLVALCNGEGIRTLRGNAWHANGFAGGKAPPYRKTLSQGRIWEVERNMR